MRKCGGIPVNIGVAMVFAPWILYGHFLTKKCWNIRKNGTTIVEFHSIHI